LGSSSSVYRQIVRIGKLEEYVKHKVLIAIIALAVFQANNVAAAESYLSGKITNITSTSAGLMLMLDTGLPDNCEGTPWGWMLIPKAETTMISVALAMYTSGRLSVTVYTNPRAATGWCTVNQFDPH
jgi:hypothetical protein